MRSPKIDPAIGKIDQETGLSESTAKKRLEEQGPNSLPSEEPRSVLAIAIGVIKEPMFLLLVGCATVYTILGDLGEALMLVGAVAMVIGITFFQEKKTERSLEALRDLSSPKARVIRDKIQKLIAGRDLVPGDIIVLSEGDRVPADSLLLSCVSLSADESLLTGESLSVRKQANESDQPMERPGGEDQPFLFSGTMIVQGHGIALVKATGLGTEIGKIGTSLQGMVPEVTVLQKSTNRLVRVFALAGLSLCIVVVIVFGLTRGNWINGILAGLTMAISMIPEEFPVVLTMFLAIGAWRLSQSKVLARRIPAIETLGSATALCVDKTGTLTQNLMSVNMLNVDGKNVEISELALEEPYANLVKVGALASQVKPFDPMEKAIQELTAKQKVPSVDLSLTQQYALSKELLAMTNVWTSKDSTKLLVAMKGAPEAIAVLCKMTDEVKGKMDQDVKTMASHGLRILAVASQDFESGKLPETQNEFSPTYLGLIAFADPVRKNAVESVKECYNAGIRVIMITGDYPDTATNISQQIGLKEPNEVITGPELAQMNESSLKERIRTVNVFARIMPEQKLQIVNALKSMGEIVVMTGDGVNDAPALKAAHIGIAMGKRGTDVAREAAALVLLDDDFSSIVRSIRLGRRIYTNIKDAMAYIISIHIPIAGLSLFPVLFGWPLILLPVHVVILELIIDPACSIAFEAEPEDEDTMRRPPRDPKAPPFTLRSVSLSLIQGAVVLIVLIAVYLQTTSRGQGEMLARTMTYTTLIVANMGLILTNLSWSRSIYSTITKLNKPLWLMLSGVSVLVGVMLYVPAMRNLLHFSQLRLADLFLCIGIGFASVSWFEVFKIVKRRKQKGSVSNLVTKTR